MNGQHIPGTPIVVDFWRLREAPPRALFFLTHMHADHTSGLSAFWSYPIHCSPITARLLKRKFKINPKLVVELEVGESRMLHVNCPGDHVTVTVTTLDANHCPGSVMFLFEGYFGSILYTGDFRLSPSMLTHPLLNGSRAIDVLYLDNTYCHPSCQFPTREEVAKAIVSVIRDNPNYMYLIGLHNLGKEDLLVTLATELRTWVGVSPERYETLKELEMPAVFSMESRQCQISVYPFHMIAKSMLAELNSVSTAVAILPTCLFSGAGAPPSPSNPNIKVFPYSDHSSYQELWQFVASVRPRSIRPVVRKFSGDREAVLARSNMGVFDNLLDPSPPHGFEIPASIQRLLSMKSHNQETPRLPLTPPVTLRKRSSLTSSGSRASKSRAKGVQFVSPVKTQPLREAEDGEPSKDEVGRTGRDDNRMDSESLQLMRTVDPKLSEDQEKSNPVKPPEKCRYKPLLFESSESNCQVEIPESATGNPNSESQDKPVVEDGPAGPEPMTVDVLGDQGIEPTAKESQLNFIVQSAQGNVEFESQSTLESELSLVIEAVEGNVEMSPEEEWETLMSSQFESSEVAYPETVACGSGPVVGVSLCESGFRRQLPPTVLDLLPLSPASPFTLALQKRGMDQLLSCEHRIEKALNLAFSTSESGTAEKSQNVTVSDCVGDRTPCDVQAVHSPQKEGAVCSPTPEQLSHTVQDVVTEIPVSTVKPKANAFPKYQGPLCTCSATSSEHPDICLVGLEEFLSNSSTADFMTQKRFEQWVCDL